MAANHKSQTMMLKSDAAPLFGWMRLAWLAQRDALSGESGAADQGCVYVHESLLTHFERPQDWSLLTTSARMLRVFSDLQEIPRWDCLLIGTYRLWLFSDWETLAHCVRNLVRDEPDVFAGENIECANWLLYAGVHAECLRGEPSSASDLRALIRFELSPLLRDYDTGSRAGMLRSRGLYKAALTELDQFEHAEIWDRYLKFMALETQIICSQATGDFRGVETLLMKFAHVIHELNISCYREVAWRAQLSFYNEWERFDESARMLSLSASEASGLPSAHLLQLQEKIRFDLVRGDVDNLRRQKQGRVSRSVLAFGEERCRFLILTHASLEAWQFCEAEYKKALIEENYASQAAIGFCYARALAEVGREQQALVVCRAARSLADEQSYCKIGVMVRILESVLLTHFHRQEDARSVLNEARNRAEIAGFQMQLLCVELIELLLFSEASIREILSEKRLVSVARKIRSFLNYYLPTSIHRVRRAGKLPAQSRGEPSAGIVPFFDAIRALFDCVSVVFLVHDGLIIVSKRQNMMPTLVRPTPLSSKIFQLLLISRLRTDASAIHDLQFPGICYDKSRHSSKVRMAVSRLRTELSGLTHLVRIRHDAESGSYRLESKVPVYTFEVEHIRNPERHARASLTSAGIDHACVRSREESRKLIVDALQAVGSVGLCTAELCELLGISRQALNKTVSDLLIRGVIERLGRGKATRYRIGR